jgi:hypothetical protein
MSTNEMTRDEQVWAQFFAAQVSAGETINNASELADAMMNHYRDRFGAMPMAQELASLRAFKRGVDEALNSGDGSYRP